MESKSFSLNIQENPMHIKEQQKKTIEAMEIELSVASDNNNNEDNNTTTITTSSNSSPTLHRIKLLLFLIVTLASVAALFYFTEVATRTIRRDGIQVDLLDQPVTQIMFNVALIGGITNVAIQASGLAASHQPNDIRNYKLSNIWIVTVVLITFITMIAEPAVYIRPSVVLNKPMGRGECVAPIEVDREFFDVCPSFRKNYSFVQPNPIVSNSNDRNMTAHDPLEETQKYFSNVKLLESVSGLLRAQATKFKFNPMAIDPTCIYSFVDTLCEATFSRCQYETCRIPKLQDLASTCGMRFQAQKWLQCGIKVCESDSASCEVSEKVDDYREFFNADGIEDFVGIFADLLNRLESSKKVTPDELKMVKDVFKHLPDALNKTANDIIFQNECAGWEDHHVLSIDETNSNNHSNTSCDPNRTSYQIYAKEIKHDGTYIYLTISCVLFLIFIYFLEVESDKALLLNLNLSSVRLACCFIAIIMSVLVFIGGIELQKAARINNNQDQKVWAVFYFLVSFYCLHGAISVLTPKRKTEVERFMEANVSILQKKRRKRKSSVISPEIYQQTSRCCCSKKKLDALQGFAKYIKTEFMEAGGSLFALKLFVVELSEFALQFASLLSSAATSDALEVAVSAVVIAVNMIALPLTAYVATRCFKSKSNVVAATLAVELIFDKLFTAVAVLYRPSTITELNLSVVDQISRHGGCLIPALMTFLDVEDALTLSEQSSKKDDSEITEASASTSGAITKSTLIIKIGASLSIIGGLLLGTYSIYSFNTQNDICYETLGNVIACARPRLYWSKGFLNSTNCAFDMIETMNCREGIMKNKTRLPDAIDAYSQMSKLTIINVSGNVNLVNAPKGWAFIPNSHKLILTDNPSMTELPYVICTGSNLKSIELVGSKASETIDWTNQIYQYRKNTNSRQVHTAHKITTSITRAHGPIYINSACQKELYPTVTSLSLANNSLVCDVQFYDDYVNGFALSQGCNTRTHGRLGQSLDYTDLCKHTLSAGSGKLDDKRTEFNQLNQSHLDCDLIDLKKFKILTHINLDENHFRIMGQIIVKELDHVVHVQANLDQFSSTSGLGSAFESGSGVTLRGSFLQNIDFLAQLPSTTKGWLGKVLPTANISKLEFLDLRKLDVSWEEFYKFPIFRQENKNDLSKSLRYLSLAYNDKWEGLHGILNGLSSLQFLGLERMMLTNLNRQLDGLFQLKSIQLTENRLTYDGLKGSNGAFRDLTDLDQVGGYRGVYQNADGAGKSFGSNYASGWLPLTPVEVHSSDTKNADRGTIDRLGSSLLPLVNLHGFILSNNKLTVLDFASFHNTTTSIVAHWNQDLTEIINVDQSKNVEDLHLWHCKLSTVILNHTKLKNLYLQYNKLTTLTGETFDGSNELKFLDLQHNQISHIDIDTFATNKKLDYLDLAHNHLTWIDVRVFDRMPILPRVMYLNDNKMNDSVKNELQTYFITKRNMTLENGELKGKDNTIIKL